MKNKLLAICAALAIIFASCSKQNGSGMNDTLGKTNKTGKDVENVDNDGKRKPPVDTSNNGGNDNPGNPDCENVYCTFEFRMIDLQVVDAKGNAVKLDSYYTEDMNGNKLPSHLYEYNNYSSAYVVFNDSWMAGNQNSSIRVRFVGFKNGIKVVSEDYLITSDCCHISKQSGKDRVVLP